MESEESLPEIPEPLDLRFAISDSIYMEKGKSYCVCGLTFVCAEKTGFYDIIIAGKLLGSGVVQAETVSYEAQEGHAQ